MTVTLQRKKTRRIKNENDKRIYTRVVILFINH